MAEVKYTVRNMVKDEVPKALDIWRETGMNTGINGLYIWLEVDPEAFKIAVTDEGEIIGVCSAVIHHDDLAFLGLYCVRKKYRGLGIGFKIWNACLEHIGHRNAYLYADPDKAELYQSRGGFPYVEPKWSIIVQRSYSPVNADKLSDSLPKEICVKPFVESHLPLIYDYDKKLMGYDRKLTMELSCKQPDSKTHVAVKGDECVGFGTIKVSCQNTAIVGPLYADDKEVAEVMLKKLILSLPQVKGLFMLTLSNNDAANELVQRIGCFQVIRSLHLYRKQPLDKVDHSKIYGIIDANFSTY